MELYHSPFFLIWQSSTPRLHFTSEDQYPTPAPSPSLDPSMPSNPQSPPSSTNSYGQAPEVKPSSPKSLICRKKRGGVRWVLQEKLEVAKSMEYLKDDGIVACFRIVDEDVFMVKQGVNQVRLWRWALGLCSRSLFAVWMEGTLIFCMSCCNTESYTSRFLVSALGIIFTLH